MNTKLIEQAEKLAAEPYSVDIMRDETTTGETVFLLSHPELLGCMAQGQRLDEARDNLADATKEYILSLLEDGLPVPLPQVRLTTTTVINSETYTNKYLGQPERTFLDDLSSAAQPLKRSYLGTVSLIKTG